MGSAMPNSLSTVPSSAERADQSKHRGSSESCRTSALLAIVEASSMEHRFNRKQCHTELATFIVQRSIDERG